MIETMIIAGIGGFFGTIGRYLVGKLMKKLVHTPFPYGTFVVNILGCFIIGIFIGLVTKTRDFSVSEANFLITGFCGGFTTFSSFEHDSVSLFTAKKREYFVGYVVLSLVLGFIAVWIGKTIV